MKKILLTAIVCGVFQVNAQDFTFKPNGTISEITVVVENLYADIEIEGTTSSDIEINAEDYDGIPEKAQGLKPLSATGPENTGIGLNVTQEGNIITISGAQRSADDAVYYVRIPKNIKLKLEYSSFQAGDVIVKGMTNEVEAKSQIGDLKFIGVTGPIVAHTLSSDLELVFTTINQSSPTSLTSTSGDIDITIPESTKGNFKMSSTSGEIYTDLDFDMKEEDGMRRFGGGMSASATLNGGGAQVTLRSISGDIYIRKSK